VFPPPSPWKTLAEVDPDREYMAFTSCFFLRSWLALPRFVAHAPGIQRQIDSAPGVVGWSLAGRPFSLEFYTLSAWEDGASLKRFAREAAHGTTMKKLEKDTRRPSIFVYYKVLGRDLPLSWDDALARQKAHDARQ
jgi:hypothetical protein